MTKEIIEGRLSSPSAGYRRWLQMTPEEKKKQLFLNQKAVLDAFLQRHAISRAEYERSLGELVSKMGVA